MNFTLSQQLFDYDTMLFLSISLGTGTFMLFSWFSFGKKISEENQDKNIITNNSFLKPQNSDCKGDIESSYKSIPKRIKNFLLKPVKLRLPTLRLSFFSMIFNTAIFRAKMAFKKKIVTEQTKVEASLHKLARSLWDQGKYAEAERINLEVLNVRRLVFGDKK